MRTFDLDARAEAVPRARAVVRELLGQWDLDELRDDVDLVVSELLSNVVLHAPGAARVAVEPHPEGVRVEVRDASTTRPLRRENSAVATTGRGLNLVAALCSGWGVAERSDGERGKAVWCVVPRVREAEVVPEVDLDALLASFHDEPEGVHVYVGDAPVGLLRAAKDNLDGLLRELVLSDGGRMPAEVVEPMVVAVRGFAEAREQLQAMIMSTVAEGRDRVQLAFRLPIEIAERGERYLEALRRADTFARDRRMLSLEAPVEHRVLREWYVEGLVAGLRRAARGEPPAPWESLEERLLREVHRLEQAGRAARLGASLQGVTARLAAAGGLRDIAATALEEGVRALGASGGALTRDDDGRTVEMASTGTDAGLGQRYEDVPADVRRPGPSTQVLRSGEAVWVESREERDERYPHLAQVQPAGVAIAVLPLTVTGQVVGALRLSWPESRLFTTPEREFLQGLAGQTALALARAEALEQLEALRDELARLLDTEGGISATDLALLRTLYEDAPVGIAIYGADRRYLRVNEVLASASGRTAAEHVGASIGDVRGEELSEEARRVLEGLLDRVLLDGEALDEVVQDVGPDGARSWRTAWFPVRDVDGEVEAAVLLAVDITDQRRAEQRGRVLAELGARLGQDRSHAGVLAAVGDALVPWLADCAAVHLLDPAGRVDSPYVRHRDPALTPALREQCSLLPVALDQLTGPGRVLATGDTQQLPLPGSPRPWGEGPLADLAEALGVGGITVVPLMAGGRVLGSLSLGLSAARGGGRLSADDLAVAEDVGRRAGAALEGRQAVALAERLDAALDAAGIGSFDWDVASGELTADARVLQMLDVDPAAELGLSAAGEPDVPRALATRVHPGDAERVRSALQRTAQSGGELRVDLRVVPREGPERWLEVRGRALTLPDGAGARVVGTVADATGRREAESRAERTLERMGDAFFSLDTAWRFSYVNHEAERLLRQPRERLLGRVAWEVLPGAAGSVFEREYRAAVASGRAVRFEQPFGPYGQHFEVRAHPGPDGLSVYFSDVTGHRTTERERDRALERLGLLNAVGAALTATLDVDEVLSRLAGLLVPALADLAMVDICDGGGPRGVRPVVIHSADPVQGEALRAAEQVRPRRDTPGSSVWRVLHGEPLVQVEVTEAYLQALTADDGQRDLYSRARLRYGVVVPLAVRGRVFGALTLLRTGARALPFDADDVALAQEIGGRAGLMVDNAAQYTAQRVVAEGLQRSLLPELPAVPGLALGAAYEPSSSAATVGGDWYDLFVLPDGGTGLVIGDVMGHDVTAAAAMGQLRSVLRTCAADGQEPALVLDRLDRLVSSFAMADLATVVYARLDRRPDGSGVLSWANAGHPPPLLLAPGATPEFLEDAVSPMIGAPWTGTRAQASREVPAGSTLLMVTDGLMERRGQDLDEQLRGLAGEAARLLAAGAGPADLCSRLLAAVRRDADTDDAAAVAVTLL